jgi:hypothetical protein
VPMIWIVMCVNHWGCPCLQMSVQRRGRHTANAGPERPKTVFPCSGRVPTVFAWGSLRACAKPNLQEITMTKTRTLQFSILGLMLAWSASAHALPPNEVTTEYYAGADHSKLVGETILSCSGGVHKWGHSTPFKLKSSDPCGRRVATDRIPAARFLMHRDPVAACHFRCQANSHPTMCGADEVCNEKRKACDDACDLLLTPEE